jgi:asparagine synthase (glutamine-hydrolysing)
MRRRCRYVAMTPLQRHWRHISRLRDEESQALLAPDVLSQLEPGDAWQPYAAKCGLENDGIAPLNQLLMADLLTYLPDDLLVKVDIAAMAQALEPRAPFLDHKLVEFAASLSPELKLRNGTGKYLLRRIAANLVPTENLARPKHGFGVPIGRWLRHDLKHLAHDVLLSSAARQRGFFNIRYVRRLLHEHVGGQRHHGERLWQLLMLELWFQQCLDRGGGLQTRAAEPVVPREREG